MDHLCIDARIPVPFSVFPSTYRDENATGTAEVSQQTTVKVEGEVDQRGARSGREAIVEKRYTYQNHNYQPARRGHIDIDVHVDIDALINAKSEEGSSKVTVLEPIEGTGESFELWESGSAKDENETVTAAAVAVECS